MTAYGNCATAQCFHLDFLAYEYAGFEIEPGMTAMFVRRGSIRIELLVGQPRHADQIRNSPGKRDINRVALADF